MSASLCSKGYEFDADLWARISFAARISRFKLGSAVRGRDRFSDYTDESAGEAVQREMNIDDLRIAAMSDIQLHALAADYAAGRMEA